MKVSGIIVVITCVCALALSHAAAQPDEAPITQPDATPAPTQAETQAAADVQPTSRPGVEPAERVVRPYMGLTVRLLDPQTGRSLELPDEVGLKVEYVDPKGPASAAGFERGDVLHKLGDQLLINPHQLRVLLWRHKPGETVDVHRFRQGERKTIKLVLGERPAEPRMLRVPVDKNQKIQPGDIKLKAQRVMVFGDKDHRLRVTDSETGRHLRCVDSEGEVLFDGYIDTEADRAALPGVVKEKLGKMQNLQQRRGVEIEVAPLLPPSEAEQAEEAAPPREPAENESTER